MSRIFFRLHYTTAERVNEPAHDKMYNKIYAISEDSDLISLR